MLLGRFHRLHNNRRRGANFGGKRKSASGSAFDANVAHTCQTKPTKNEEKRGQQYTHTRDKNRRPIRPWRRK
jgi:hypothetical protein